MSEEDQMMRAIAMSLGQEVSMEQRSDSPEVCLFFFFSQEDPESLVWSQTFFEWVVLVSGSSKEAWGGGQESEGACRGRGGTLLRALHGSRASGPTGAALLHGLHASWLLPSFGWVAWHSLPTLWPPDDGHQEERTRVQRPHPGPSCWPGQLVSSHWNYRKLCSKDHICFFWIEQSVLSIFSINAFSENIIYHELKKYFILWFKHLDIFSSDLDKTSMYVSTDLTV